MSILTRFPFVSTLRLKPSAPFLLLLSLLFCLSLATVSHSQVPTAIRIAAPEQGSVGKSFAGPAAVSLIYGQQKLEQEFAQDGIKIEWYFFKGAGPAINEALANGQIDFAHLGDLASVIGRANGLKTQLIFNSGRGSNSYLAVPNGSSISQAADLKNKRIAILRGTAYQLSFNRILESAGLSEKDIQFINLDWPSSKAAVVAGNIDATYGGVDLNLLAQAGKAQIAFSTKTFGPEAGIYSGLLVNDAFTQAYPELVQRVVNVFVRTAHQHAADDAQSRATLFQTYAALSGLPASLFETEFADTSVKDRYSPHLDPQVQAHYEAVVKAAKAAKIIRRDFEVAKWLNPDFVQTALAQQNLENFWLPQAAPSKP